MSGGHFDYNQYQINEIVDGIERILEREKSQEIDVWGYPVSCGYSEETLKEFKKGIEILKLAEHYAHRIDWLVSGDDSEESFHKRLKEK